MRVLLFAFVLQFLAINLKAQDFTIESRVDTQFIRIGEPIKLSIDYSYDENTWEKAWIGYDSLGKFELYSDTLIKTGNEGKQEFRREMVLSIFEEGNFKTPAFQANFLSLEGDTTSIEIEQFSINVELSKLDTSKQIKDIKQPIEIPYTWRDWWYYPVGAVALTAIIILLVFYLLRRKKSAPKPKEEVIPEIPAHEKALKALNELENKKLWQSEKTGEYYDELSDILRLYLEERFNIKAMEEVSSIIIKQIERITDIDRNQKDEIINLLRNAEMAKFAKQEPTAAENEEAMRLSRSFIRSTQKETIEHDSELG